MPRVRVSITDPSQMGLFAVTSLPDTWWARRGYNMVRDAWMKRVEDIKKAQGKHGVGRWNDFKVGYDNTHHDNFGSAKIAEEVTDATGTQVAMPTGNAEWNLSELLDNDGNDRTFRMLGATSGNEFGIIQSYSNITNVFAPDPDESGTGAQEFGDLYLDGGGDQTDMDDQGDYPPYHETDFPQLEVHQGQLLSVIQEASGGGGAALSGAQGRYSTGYFDAPLGLLRITPGVSAELTIEVQEGDYKGVNAPDWK